MFNVEKELDGKTVSKLPLCGIYALSILTGKPLKEVFEGYRTLHKLPASWKGTSTAKERAMYLDSIGFPYKRIEATKEHSVKVFVRKYYNGKPLVLRYRTNGGGHVVTYFEGKIYDQSTPNGVPLENYYRSGKRVTNAIVKVDI